MSSKVRFLLGFEPREIEDVDPSQTVLGYLREVERCRGTKEGCAEGDCGACTVVLGEPDGDRMRYRAANACILFTPVLDGKQLITVEHLKAAEGRLHPAQQAMVDYHGSQCGFCTPGFVMSMFAMYHTEARPPKHRINDVLAGNLCRCTGYRPIVEAATRMYDTPQPDAFDRREAETAAALRALRRDDTLALEWRGRRYFAPRSADQLARLLVDNPDSLLLAGGTDIGLWVTKQHRVLDTLIYTGDVTELQTLEETNTHLDIGAAVTHSRAMEALGRHYPDFGELLRRFASVQIRNTGTLGGNVGNASPIGDSMPALIALDATLVLRRGAERRELPIEDYFLDYQKTARRRGEFIERIRVPLPADGHQLRCYKISKRFDQDISAVCGAFGLTLEAGRVKDIRIGFGGIAAIPKRAHRTEQALRGRPWTEATLAQAESALAAEFMPLTDMRASQRYRRLITTRLLRKCFIETTEENAATRVLAAEEEVPA